MSTSKTPDALAAYYSQGSVIAVEQRADARTALLARWSMSTSKTPDALAAYYSQGSVIAVGPAREITTDNGKKTLVAVDTKFYKHLDYGYATTVHKAQGTTVDLTYVLATPHFDRHSSYVALSRHRENACVFYATADFGGRRPGATPAETRARFVETLSRARPKELAHDYLELEAGSDEAMASSRGIAASQKPRNLDAGESLVVGHVSGGWLVVEVSHDPDRK